MQFSNPFDNPQGQFYILRNAQGQYSLWPHHCALPTGWTGGGPAHAQANWSTLIPAHYAS